VYEAVHLGVDRKVAVKYLRGEFASDPDARKRFEREAKAAGRIGHDNICEALDFGVDESGKQYFVMPLLRGCSLARAIGESAPFPVERSADIAAQALSALAAAHRQGVIHRDLKPDNIFLTTVAGRADFVKVLDFGISKVVASPGATRVPEALTTVGTILGTPYYMSPEQARGAEDLDARVDIYAMGVILYEMLTAELPITGTSVNDVLWKIWNEPVAPPSTHRPTLHPAVEQVVLRAMARDRNERFENAEEMRQALAAALAAARGRRARKTGSDEAVDPAPEEADGALAFADAETEPGASKRIAAQKLGTAEDADAETEPGASKRIAVDALRAPFDADEGENEPTAPRRGMAEVASAADGLAPLPARIPEEDRGIVAGAAGSDREPGTVDAGPRDTDALGDEEPPEDPKLPSLYEESYEMDAASLAAIVRAAESSGSFEPTQPRATRPDAEGGDPFEVEPTDPEVGPPSQARMAPAVVASLPRDAVVGVGTASRPTGLHPWRWAAIGLGAASVLAAVTTIGVRHARDRREVVSQARIVAEQPRAAADPGPEAVGEPAVAPEAQRRGNPDVAVDAAPGLEQAGTVVSLLGVPRGSRITVDGREVGAPEVLVPPGERSVLVEIEALGYETWSRRVSADQGDRVRVRMRRTGDPAAGPGPGVAVRPAPSAAARPDAAPAPEGVPFGAVP